MKYRRIFFEIPDDGEIISEVVNSVPDSWAWLDGELAPRPEIQESARRAHHPAPYPLFSLRGALFSVHGENPGHERAVLCGQEEAQELLFDEHARLPPFVRYIQAGLEHNRHTVSLLIAKNIAAMYLRYGYQGTLEFYADQISNVYRDKNSARCIIHCGPWHGKLFDRFLEQPREHPPIVEIYWREDFPATSEKVMPIIATCDALLGLRQIGGRFVNSRLPALP